MVQIYPFRGIYYNRTRIPDLQPVVTPPYDVISPEAQERYYQRHPHNMIRLDLGKEEPGDSPTENRYTRAARWFRQWLEEGILQEASQEALYPYYITYRDPQGREKRIRGFVSLVQLSPFEEGKIIPHEYTLAKPKEDRLQLLRACQAHFSQIFGLFTPPEGGPRPLDLLDPAIQGRPPFLEARDEDGNLHQVWEVTDPDLIAQIREILKDRPLYIADGHHRYETALAYREERRRQGPWTSNEGFERVMMYLTDAAGEDLTILPTHRMVQGIVPEQLQSFEARLKEYFQWKAFPFTPEGEKSVRDPFLQALEQESTPHPVVGLALQGTPAYRILYLKDPSLPEREGPPDHSPAWRKLDVSVVQYLLLERLLGLNTHPLREQHVRYTRDPQEALRRIQEGRAQLAFLLRPTPLQALLEVTRAGDRMPQKSTYFYPKLLTGLVIFRL